MKSFLLIKRNHRNFGKRKKKKKKVDTAFSVGIENYEANNAYIHT